MARGYAVIHIIGNLGRDPELNYDPSGQARCKFSVAVNQGENQNGDKETDWYNVTVWGKSGENANKFLVKGSKVFVAGRLRTKLYWDKNKNAKIDNSVSATDVQYLDTKEEGEKNRSGRKRDDDYDDDEDDEDIDFTKDEVEFD